MTDYTELNADLAEYLKPIKLGTKILNTLNKELYKADPYAYNKLISTLHHNSQQVNGVSEANIVSTWLECSEFEDEMAKRYLKNVPMSDLLKLNVPPGTNYKIMTLWFITQDSCNIPHFFQALIPTLTSTTQTTLDWVHKLKLITYILNLNKELFKDQNIKKQINAIIMSISLKKLPQVEVIKLMQFQPHLHKSIITEISKFYPKGNFDSVLSTAQILGVVETPDYWVQSLPSQQKTKTTTTLPTFE